MCIATGRWKLFVAHPVVEVIPTWERPTPQFEDFFSGAELAALDLGEAAVPELVWSNEPLLLNGPVSKGEASAWVTWSDKENRINLNPYDCLKKSLVQWRRTLLHELGHLISYPVLFNDASTGHDFAFAVTFAACQVRIGLPLRLRAYDLSDIPPAERGTMTRRAEELGERFGSGSMGLFQIPRLTSRIEAAAQSEGWDRAMRPPKRFWLF